MKFSVEKTEIFLFINIFLKSKDNKNERKFYERK